MLTYEIIQAKGMTVKKYFDVIFMLAESEGDISKSIVRKEYIDPSYMLKVRLRGPKRPTKSFVL